MASYLLYIVTGAILALMAARHFLAHASPARRAQALDLFSALPHPQHEAMHWPEAALLVGIMVVGLVLLFGGVLQLIALWLHLG
jgi:hypothetical protein